MQTKTSIALLLAAALALMLMPTAALAEGALTVTGGAEDMDYKYEDGGRRVRVLTGTQLTISGRPSTASVVIHAGVEANLTLDNATIEAPAGSAIHLFSGSKLNLTVVGDNTLTGTENYAGIDVAGSQILVITKESTGTLNVTGGEDGAGIGGGWRQSGGTIIIQGGTVKATSPSSGTGAGIGGGSLGKGGVIFIEGGTVEAKGGWWGAGIGGAADEGGRIIISGGWVNAIGEGGGAGIGGGIGSDGGNITISGGTVNAVSKIGGAGIGGGLDGDGGNITISGGRVNAVSESMGAGIGGGGWNGSGAELKITGGVVFADSSTGPMDVGAGLAYSNPDVPRVIPTEGSLEISADAALFLKHGTCPTPTTTTHTKESITGHAANSDAYGISVAWGGNFDAYLRLCKLSYDLNGGSGDLPAAVTQHIGTVASIAAGSELSRTGHHAFSVWNTAANGSGTDFAAGEIFSFPENDVTLFAKWTPYTYTVHYNANGGQGNTEASIHTYDVERALTPNGFTRPGYTFAGWATGAVDPVVYRNMQSVLNLTPEDNGEVTLYSQWKVYSEPNPTPTPRGTIINCRSYVNVRSGPGTNYPILGFAPRSAAYTVMEKAGAWYKVEFGGQVGYISSRYLAVPAPGAGQGMVVNCNHSVNVRSGPGTNYPILGFAPRSASYTVMEKAGAWYKVEFGGQVGYISSRYLAVPAPGAGQGMVVNCNHSVNVRSGPGRRYSILGFAPRDAAYTIIAKSGSWYKIEFNGHTAYISADYFLTGDG